tara:strand:- start:17121 stop:18734 length:1614 start_codon:yes stop_codon:yes gene_type:complete
LKGVIVCPQVEAVEIGRRIFEEGGNAIDAAVATAFAQGIAEPHQTSIGGNGTLQVFHAESGEHLVIDFYGRAPLKSTQGMWSDKVIKRLPADMWELEGNINQVGYLSVTVPGTLKAFYEVANRFGNMSWKDLIQPAIDLAKRGFIIPSELYQSWIYDGSLGYSDTKEILKFNDVSSQIFAPNGDILKTGEQFIMKDYSETLEMISIEGPDLMYKGELGRIIAKDFLKHGGLITQEDFLQYKLRINSPIKSNYRGYTVCANLAPGSGPQIIETLNILEGYDLNKIGFGTPEYSHLLSQAQKAGFVDRAKYLADPDYESVPIEKIISKDHAMHWKRIIDNDEDIIVPNLDMIEGHDTTTVSSMDEKGNAIAITHTLGSPCSGVVVKGLGFLFNNSMHVFNPYPGHPNSIAPGKARTTGMSPTIVLKNGKPFIITSAPGAVKILTANLQTILNIIDHDMSVLEAVSAPRIHSEGKWIDVEARLYYRILEYMNKKGHKIKKSDLSYDPFFALVHAITSNDDNSVIKGAADPRGRGGYAEVK